MTRLVPTTRGTLRRSRYLTKGFRVSARIKPRNNGMKKRCAQYNAKIVAMTARMICATPRESAGRLTVGNGLSKGETFVTGGRTPAEHVVVLSSVCIQGDFRLGKTTSFFTHDNTAPGEPLLGEHLVLAMSPAVLSD